MRRLGRWTLNALTVVSLLLCVGTAGLWVESYRVSAALYYRMPLPSRWEDHTERWGQMAVSRGEIAVMYDDPSDVYDPMGHRWHLVVERPALALSDRFGALPVDFSYFGVLHTWLVTIVPLRYPAAVFAALPLARWCMSLKNRLRGDAGLCRRCSYDLTGNVSGACPECGTKVVKGNA